MTISTYSYEQRSDIMYRKLPSLDFKYEINENGEIRNIKSKKMLKLRINRTGYLTMGYNDKKRGHSVPKEIHRLVAEAFLINVNNLPVINHKDGDKLNNNVSNLEWCTYSQNSKHAYLSGLTPKPPINKPKNIELKNLTENISFKTYKEAYKWCIQNKGCNATYKTFVGEIRKTCKGMKKHTYGSKWSFQKPVSTIS